MTLLKDKSVGELTYNYWTFDAMHRSKVSNVPVYDDAGRVLKWQEVTIEVEGDIDLRSAVDGGAYSNFSDAALGLLRALDEPGHTLHYVNKGFGDFYVNSPQSNVRDLNWGPKPKVLDFVPIGSNQVVHVVWKVVCHVNHCPGAFHKDHVFNLTFEVGYKLDKHGYLQMNVQGGYEIPLTFSTNQGAGGNLGVVSSADKWWEKVCPPVRNGFERESDRRVSRDRRRVDFTVTDKELPVPLLSDCTMIEARHRVRGNRQRGFNLWNSTISGTIHVNPRQPRSLSWDRFMVLLSSRINWARSQQLAPNAPASARGIRGVLLTDIDFEENVFGTEQRFSVNYQILGGSLSKILKHAGLWLPVPGTSHAAWTVSMTKPYAPRGINGAEFTFRDDVMIDLCNGPTSQQAPTPAKPNKLQELKKFIGPDRSPASAVAAANGEAYWFAPENSWISYTANLWFAEDDNVIRHKPLAGKVSQDRPKFLGNGQFATQAKFTDNEFSLADWDTPDILQTVCSPDTSVVLYGNAMRFGYRLSPPRLLKCGTKDVKQVKNDVVEVQLGAVMGVPIWGLAWRIEYALSEPAKDLPILANPLLRTDGDDRPDLALQQTISAADLDLQQSISTP